MCRGYMHRMPSCLPTYGMAERVQQQDLKSLQCFSISLHSIIAAWRPWLDGVAKGYLSEAGRFYKAHHELLGFMLDTFLCAIKCSSRACHMWCVALANVKYKRGKLSSKKSDC